MTAGASQSQTVGAVRPDQPGWENRLAALVGAVVALYAQLDALGDRQEALVAGDGVDELLDLLAERQGLIDRIAELGEYLRPCVAAWEDLSSRVDEGRRRALGEGLAAIERAGVSIARRDEDHKRRLERRRDDVADRLAGIGRARAAVSAYSGGPRRSDARFQDREG